MAKRSTKLPCPAAVFTAAELGEIAGIDRETVNNWIRRGIIKRSTIGGRRLRNRLFSTDEVYKAALISELVQLGIVPSLASHAVNDVWKQWQRSDLRRRQNIHVALIPNNRKIRWQNQSGELLRQLSSGSVATGLDFSRQAFAVIPISEVVAEVAGRVARLSCW